MIILFIIGTIMIVKGYVEQFKNCPLPKIEYRYIPRNFYEEQINSVNLKNYYSDLFDEPETWQRYPLGAYIDGNFDSFNYGNFIREYGGKVNINDSDYEDDSGKYSNTTPQSNINNIFPTYNQQF